MSARPFRQAAALAAVVLATSVSPTSGWTQAAPPSEAGLALSWLRSAATAPRRVSYEGTKSVTIWGGQVQASQVRIFHAAPDRTRLEYLPAGNQPGRLVIITGGTMVEYAPSRNEIVERRAPAPDEERLSQGVLPQILSNYTVSFAGTESVAGRETRVIAVQSKYPGRPSLRIWVDRQRQLILRFERYRPDGTLGEVSAFLNIRYDPAFPPDLFTLPAPPGTRVQQQRIPGRLSAAEIAQRVGFTPQTPAYLPSGFAQRGARVITVGGQPTATFVYSDGVSTVTLFERRGPQGPPSKGRPVRIGSVEGTVAPRGMATLLHWNVGPISFTLVGDLPQGDLVRIAASVPQVSGRPPWPDRLSVALRWPGIAEAAAPAAPRPWPGIPPVPIAPYITNYTNPIGPGLAVDEVRIWRALRNAKLSPFVVKVTVATDGVTRTDDGGAGAVAWIWFVYGMDWHGDGAQAVISEVQHSARALAVTAFRTVPHVVQVVLTGQYQVSGPFDGRRTDVTFTARVYRDLLLAAPDDLDPGLALGQAGDVWYSPALLAGSLVMAAPRAHRETAGGARRGRPPALAGDRSAEAAAHFEGTLVQRIVETKRRLDGILFGVESGGRLWRGNPRRREIALTFDDGPHPLATPLLLNVLHRFGVPGTFFVIGEHAAAYPYLVRQMSALGDEVEDHTFHHPRLTTLDASTARAEIDAASEVLRPLAGEPRWFRPPGGDYNVEVVDAARQSGMRLAMWTANSGDWSGPPPKALAERVLARAEPGAIILLHNGTLNTVAALPEIITELRRRGYDLVPVSELARDTE